MGPAGARGGVLRFGGPRAARSVGRPAGRCRCVQRQRDLTCCRCVLRIPTHRLGALHHRLHLLGDQLRASPEQVARPHGRVADAVVRHAGRHVRARGARRRVVGCLPRMAGSGLPTYRWPGAQAECIAATRDDPDQLDRGAAVPGSSSTTNPACSWRAAGVLPMTFHARRPQMITLCPEAHDTAS